jgi:hypothetical protein
MELQAGAEPRADHGSAELPSAAVPPGRFVPRGVDPLSWMSFEGRIEERRFRSLLRSAQEAMDRGDAVAARLAVEEAGELRPDAPEVAEVSEAVAMLPIRSPAADTGSFMESRTFRAAGMLVFGVTLMLALDWLRADPTPPTIDTAALGRGTGAREPDILASVSRGQTEAGILDRLPSESVDSRQPEPQAITPTSTAGGTPQAGAAAGASTTTPARPTDERTALPSAAVPTVRAVDLPAGEVPDDFVATTRVTAAAVVTSRPAEPIRGEIPDDYVAAPPVTTRSTVTSPTPASPAAFEASAASRETSSGALPLGNVVREPAPAATLGNRGAGGGNAPAAAASAAAAIPRDDRSQVMTVVDSYTRAFERLDARAARAVWPNVDERALGRAFNEIESQSFNFSGPCDVDVQGARATASCRGTARYVVKVGNREPRTEPRTWDIRLSRSGDEWFIDSVRVASR